MAKSRTTRKSKAENMSRRGMEGGNVDTFCWSVCERPRNSSSSFCVIDSDAERSEAVKVSRVPSRHEGAFELIMYSLVFDDC